MNEASDRDGPPAKDRATEQDAGWLNRNVVGMGLTSLLSDAGHEMATAVLAGFLAVLGAPVYALGLIEGVSDALSSFVKLGAGWWSDRLGHRKAIVTTGYALTGTAKALFALALGWPLVLVGRSLAWFGRGIRGPLRDAILAESVPAKDRGKAFGFHRAGDTIGAIIGPLIAGWLLVALLPYAELDPSQPFRIIFLLTLIPGLGSALAFALVVREKRRPADPTIRFWASVRALPAPFRCLLAGVGVFGLGDFSPTLLILAATSLMTPEYGPIAAAQTGALLYALRNALYAAASYPVGAASDRYSRRGLLGVGYVLAALVMIGFAAMFFWTVTSLLGLAILFALAGVFTAFVDALEGALTADLVPHLALRGTAFGVVGTVNGVGDFVSSVVVGLLWSVHPALGFGYAALMMLAGEVLLGRVR
jgi:MFS family permease